MSDKIDIYDEIDGLTENEAHFVIKAMIAAGRVGESVVTESIKLAKNIVVNS